MAARWLRFTLGTTLIAGLALASAWSTAELAGRMARGRAGGELMYYPSGVLLRPMALGHPETLADLLWLRAIQYYGEHRLSDGKFPAAGHLFETIATLDPYFAAAYLFGGIVLMQEGNDLERGIALLRRGMAWNPERWDLAFETGFAYYVGALDNDQAARFFTLAAHMEGAPEYVIRFAAYVRGRIGDKRAALDLWEELGRETENPAIRELAARRAAELKAELSTGKRRRGVTGGGLVD
jgi:tetratricopeptide (TPR) repeat protein